MKVDVHWAGKMGFTGLSAKSHNEIRLDASTQSGGEGLGVSPMEAVLVGLAGCSGMDIVSILRKKRIDIADFKIAVDAQQADDHPRVFTKINLIYSFSGKDLSKKPLEDSVRLSIDRYCSVAGMLKQTADLEWQVEINNAY